MNKSELIDAIAADAGITKHRCRIGFRVIFRKCKWNFEKKVVESLVGFGILVSSAK
jgi:nucleoid DNA-binding protein